MFTDKEELIAYNKIIAANIKSRRKELGYSVVSIADALNITHQQYYKYEAAVDRITAPRLVKVSLALRMNFDDVFKGIESKPLEIRTRKQKRQQSAVKQIIDNTI